MGKPEAVAVEKTDAELVAEEVAKIKAVNDAADEKRKADAAKGKPPAPTRVDKTAQEAALAAADAALERVTALQHTRIESIITARPRNIVADAIAILNMYSVSTNVKISYSDDNKVTIVL